MTLIFTLYDFLEDDNHEQSYLGAFVVSAGKEVEAFAKLSKKKMMTIALSLLRH